MTALVNAPRELPLLFSAPMVLAVLRDVDPKTVTRRLLRPQPPSVEAVQAKAGIGFSIFTDGHTPGRFRVAGPVWAVRDLMGVEPGWRCPYGVAGDRLWVRERMRVIEVRRTSPSAVLRGISHEIRVRYEADGKESGWIDYPDRLAKPVAGKCLAYGGHREGSRITLEVLSVCVERLQEITDDDAISEGVSLEGLSIIRGSARQRFAELWDEINGDRIPWASNSWVWRVEFRRLEVRT
jgi:hypothetical protein